MTLIDRLLAAWRDNRCHELGDAVVALEGPWDVERVDELEALLERAPDPRLSAGVAAVLEDLRPAATGVEADTHALWLRCAEVVERLDDPTLLALRDAPLPWNSDWNVGGLTLRLGVALDALARRFPDGVPPLASQHGALLAEARSRIPGDDEEERAWLEAIYAAPHDDGPRIVYADWLAERGDARAAQMQLQLRGDLPEVATPPAWCGPLAPIVVRGALRRGFLAKAHIAWRHRGNIARLGAHPAWATVEHVVFEEDRMPQYLDPAATRSLLRVEALNLAGIDMLCSAPEPWTIRAVGVDAVPLSAARRLLSARARLPALAEITFAPHSRREMWTLQREASRLHRLERMILKTPALTVDLTRGPEHRLTHTRVSGYAEHVVELLEMAPEYAFTHLEIEAELSDGEMRRVDDAAARQRGLDDIVIIAS